VKNVLQIASLALSLASLSLLAGCPASDNADSAKPVARVESSSTVSEKTSATAAQPAVPTSDVAAIAKADAPAAAPAPAPAAAVEPAAAVAPTKPAQ